MRSIACSMILALCAASYSAEMPQGPRLNDISIWVSILVDEGEKAIEYRGLMNMQMMEDWINRKNNDRVILLGKAAVVINGKDVPITEIVKEGQDDQDLAINQNRVIRLLPLKRDPVIRSRK